METSRLHIIGLFVGGNPKVTKGSPLQRASNAESATMLWYRHVQIYAYDRANLHHVIHRRGMPVD